MTVRTVRTVRTVKLRIILYLDSLKGKSIKT